MATTSVTGTTATKSAEDIYNQKLEAAKQLVENEYQTSVNALNESQAATADTYQNDRNSAYNAAAQSQKTAAQNYADLGLSRSGSMNTVDANINANRDNAVNTINSNKTQAATALANRLAELNASRAQSLTGLESDYNEDLLNYNLEKSNLTGTLDGESTLAAQELASRIKQYDTENALNEAQLTGLYNGTDTVAAQELAAQIESNKNEQALSQLEALLNYNLGVGELTEAVPVVDDFNYGDSLVELLKQLGLS